MAAPSGAVFSWGANSYGQLSIGNLEDKLSPVRADQIPKDIKNIVGGGGHSIFLSGQCFTVGWNIKGQLGVGGENCHLAVQLDCDTRDVITRVAAGWDFTLAVTKAKKLLGWGNNAWGQLGLDVKQTDTPTVIGAVCDVVDVACGLRHSVVLTDKGDVYTSGAGKKGQLGVLKDGASPSKQLNTFVKVSLPKASGKVIQVVAGAYHTAALTDTGSIVVWGDNKHGQVGKDPSDVTHIYLPELLHTSGCMPRSIKQIASGWTHMLALTDSGELYSWGRGDYGQLGRALPADSCHMYTPGAVQIERVKCVATGAEHNLAVTEEGELHAWGWNEHGMCGMGHEENVATPRPVPALQGQRVTSIACGAGHSFASVQSVAAREDS